MMLTIIASKLLSTMPIKIKLSIEEFSKKLLKSVLRFSMIYMNSDQMSTKDKQSNNMKTVRTQFLLRAVTP